MQECGRRGELEGRVDLTALYMCVHLSVYITALCATQDVLSAGMHAGGLYVFVSLRCVGAS